MEEEFADIVLVKGKPAPGITGLFEITVNGELVHSKKNGNGYVDTKGKMDRIFAAIRRKLRH